MDDEEVRFLGKEGFVAGSSGGVEDVFLEGGGCEAGGREEDGQGV